MKKMLTQRFFERPVLEIAPELLGKYLVRRWKGQEQTFHITEVEAYDGVVDKDYRFVLKK